MGLLAFCTPRTVVSSNILRVVLLINFCLSFALAVNIIKGSRNRTRACGFEDRRSATKLYPYTSSVVKGLAPALVAFSTAFSNATSLNILWATGFLSPILSVSQLIPLR